MSTVDMVTVRMSRGELSTPWGFEVLPSGTITQITGGSLADRAGLHNGDYINEIQGVQNPSIEQAAFLLRSAKHEIDLVVLREPTLLTAPPSWESNAAQYSTSDGSVSSGFSPNYSNHQNPPPPPARSISIQQVMKHASELQHHDRPFYDTAQHSRTYHLNGTTTNTTTPAVRSSSADHNDNVTSSPQEDSSKSSYLSPVDKYLLEKGGLFGTDPRVMKAVHTPSYMQSEALKLIQEEEKTKKPRQPAPPKPSPQARPQASPASNGQAVKLAACFLCGKPIIGVNSQNSEVLVHPDCFQCSTCGASLKGVQHHFLNDKFYCDVHGQQIRQQLGTNSSATRSAPFVRSPNTEPPLNPDLAVKIPLSAHHPSSILEPPRGFYQPDVLSPGPLPPIQPPPRPLVDSLVKAKVYDNETYHPESVKTEKAIVIGKMNQQVNPATKAARQMSRTFAPFTRSKSVRGIQWPPPCEKEHKQAEAIRYWKLPQQDHLEQQPKTLKELIDEDNEAAKKNVRDIVPEKAKMYGKRVVATPHRLLTPMRNPLDAYAEKVKSASEEPTNLTRTKSAVSIQQLGPPPAVNVSWHEMMVQTRPKMQSPNQEENFDELTLGYSPEPPSISLDATLIDEWKSKSEILEEKDIMTDGHTDVEDNDEDDTSFIVPPFDEKTTDILKTLGDEEPKKLNTCQDESEKSWQENSETENENTGFDAQEFEKQCIHELERTPIPIHEDLYANTDGSANDQALESIELYQHSLQNQQDHLSRLLDNAIRYLKDSDMQRTISTLEEANNNNSKAQMLEMPSPVYFETPSEKIVRNLEELRIKEHQGSTYENQSTVNHNYDNIPPQLSPRRSQPTAVDSNRQRGVLMNQSTLIPICEQCKRQINGAYVLAGGLTWCPEHFSCANPACNRRLLDTGFVEERGKKYCEKCFETLIAPICNKCGIPITADCLTALQKQWHPECFVCSHCTKPFGNAAFYLENGKPYCEHDWNTLFTTKCVSCKFPIEAGDRWVEAIGSAFHSNCFCCTVCQSNLEGQSFYAKNGQPFCRIHA